MELLAETIHSRTHVPTVLEALFSHSRRSVAVIGYNVDADMSGRKDVRVLLDVCLRDCREASSDGPNHQGRPATKRTGAFVCRFTRAVMW